MKSKILIGACLSLASLGCLAETSVSNFVKVGHTTQEHDVLTGDYTGIELSGSYKLNDDFFLTGEYISTEEDRDLEFVRKSIGVGMIISADENSAWYTEFGSVNVQFDRDYAASFDQTGFQLGFGYQIEVAEGWTLNAEVTRVHARKVDDTFGDFSPTYITLGGQYQFSESFGAYGEYEHEQDGARAAFGIKFSF